MPFSKKKKMVLYVMFVYQQVKGCIIFFPNLQMGKLNQEVVGSEFKPRHFSTEIHTLNYHAILPLKGSIQKHFTEILCYLIKLQ